MGRKRSKRDRNTPEARAERVLGGAKAGVKELFGLIHQVNPTDRGLEPDSELERYRLKSALQSLLIRQFPEAVRVAVEPDGTLALNHPLGVMDACHAVLSELDDDAQSWARARLDEADWDRENPDPSRPNPLPPAAAPGPTLDPLASGRQALANYDYERAVADFTAAARRPLLRREAALELIGLLVETLADHERAEQAARAFPKGIADDPQIAELRAVGAARAGALDRAWELLPLRVGRGAHEALLLIGRGAARDGRRDRLDAALARLPRSARGARAELLQCREELIASALGGQLDALRAALQAGNVAEAERLAAMLAGHELPTSGHALVSAVRELKARAQREELERAVAQAKAEGDLDAAARWAWALAESAPEWEARAEALDAAAYSKELARRVAKAEELLAADAPVAMYAWLALPEDGRALVDHPSTARLRQHAARLDAAFDEDPDAVAAARQLCAAEGCSQPEDIVAALSHPMLANDPVAAPLRQRAQKTLADRKQGTDAAALASAREALSGGDWARALELLAPLPTRVSAPLTVEASALRDAEAALMDDPLTALALLGSVRSLRPEVAQERLARSRARVQVACEVTEHPVHEAGLQDVVPREDAADRQLTTQMFPLDAERACLYLAGGDRVLFRVVDGSGELLQAVSLRVPEPFVLPACAAGDGDQILVLDGAGWLLTVSLDRPQVVSRVRVAGLHRAVLGVCLVDSCFLWVLHEGRGGVVVDVRDGRVVRSLPDLERFAVTRPQDASVVVVDRGKRVTAHQPDGRGARFSGSAWAGSTSILQDRSRPGGLLRMDLNRASRELVVRRGVLGGASEDAGSLGTVRSLAMWAAAAAPPYLMYRTTHPGEAGALVAYGWDDEGRLAERWRSAMVHWAAASSSDVGRSLVLLGGLRRPWVGYAGAEAPQLEQPLPASGRPPASVGLFAPCAAKKPSRLYVAFDTLIGAMSSRRLAQEIEEALGSHTRPGRLNALAHALLEADDKESLRRLLAGVDLAAFEQAGETGGAQLRRGLARAAAAIGEWDTVVDLLQPSAFQRGGALGQHAHHLLGVALLHRGDTKGALATLRAGQSLIGGCPLDLLIQSADPGSTAPAHGAPCVVHLRWAMRQARALLRAGDAAAAALALDTPPLWALLDPDGLRLLDRAQRESEAPAFRRLVVQAALASVAQDAGEGESPSS